MSAKMLGILGGMGPAATVDLYAKVIRQTPARCDQDHIPVVIHSLPQIPDRGDYLEGRGASPLPYLVQGVQLLKQAGASCVAVACNTAHAWHHQMQSSTTIPVLHIADAACIALRRQSVQPKVVGLLCTRAALKADIYQTRLRNSGYECVTPIEEELEELVMRGIYCVKRGELSAAGPLLERAAVSLQRRGAEKILLACTELPLVLGAHTDNSASEFLDATLALAQACVVWWLEAQASPLRQVQSASV